MSRARCPRQPFLPAAFRAACSGSQKNLPSPRLGQKSPHPVSLKGQIYFFFAVFCFAFAQRLRCASAIVFLPAGDRVLFFGAPADSDAGGLPLRLPEAVPTRRERADCRRAISASRAERMSRVFIPVRYQSVRPSRQQCCTTDVQEHTRRRVSYDFIW
jgi:hypothetical protein